MERIRVRLAAVLAVVMAIALPVWPALTAETGMSFDDSGAAPGAPAPHIAAPGSVKPQVPLNTSGTPAVGGAPLQGGLPPREVQPGEETPQLDPGTGAGTVSGIRRRGDMNSGDDDDMDDQEVERRTVQGVETPGKPAGGTRAASGGDGTQTEDELYVGRKAGETPLSNTGPSPAESLPAGSTNPAISGGKLAAPVLPVTERRPGAIVLPQENCGTFHTGWVDDPNADVNPCPTQCERGERIDLKEHKSGETTQYEAIYRCSLPELVVNQPAWSLQPLTEDGKPRQNCGTFWTSRQDDPDADVNPCPANCERGELRWVRRGRSDDKLTYEMNYQCYIAEPAHAKKTPAALDTPSAPAATTPLGGTVLERPQAKPTLMPPAAVTGFTATGLVPDKIELTWNPAAGVTGYRLSRQDLGGNLQPINLSAATNPSRYTDSGLQPGTYRYTIVPINSAGENAVDPATATAILCNPGTVSLRAATPGKERCFGAIGMQCAGGQVGTQREGTLAEAAAPPGVVNADCSITQNVSVGSIMHDNCCVTNNGNGAYCSGEAPGTDELDPVCMREWRKAVWNSVDGRTWRQSFGPYLAVADSDDLGATMSPRAATTNGVLGFRDDPQPWPGPERAATRLLKAPPGTALDVDSAAYCAGGRFSTTDWKGPLLTKGSEYARWIADKQNEISGRDAWINGKIVEKDAAWSRSDVVRVAALEVEINAARAQNTAAQVDLAKLNTLRDAQYLARVTEWGICQ